MTFTYDSKAKLRRGAAPQKPACQSHENHFLDLNFCDNQINKHGDDSSCEGSRKLIPQPDEHKQEYTRNRYQQVWCLVEQHSRRHLKGTYNTLR
jgi:hypothetical protein